MQQITVWGYIGKTLTFLPSQEKVPVKWMAPVQLSMAPGDVRTYDKTTDIWPYNVGDLQQR